MIKNVRVSYRIETTESKTQDRVYFDKEALSEVFDSLKNDGFHCNELTCNSSYPSATTLYYILRDGVTTLKSWDKLWRYLNDEWGIFNEYN